MQIKIFLNLNELVMSEIMSSFIMEFKPFCISLKNSDCFVTFIFRSDAESVSTTISQDSRESNKENRPGQDTRHSRDLEEEVVLRHKPEFKVSIMIYYLFCKNN